MMVLLAETEGMLILLCCESRLRAEVQEELRKVKIELSD